MRGGGPCEDTKTPREEGHMKMGTEIGRRHLQAQNTNGAAYVRSWKNEEGIFPTAPSGECDPTNTLISNIWPP